MVFGLLTYEPCKKLRRMLCVLVFFFFPKLSLSRVPSKDNVSLRVIFPKTQHAAVMLWSDHLLFSLCYSKGQHSSRAINVSPGEERHDGSKLWPLSRSCSGLDWELFYPVKLWQHGHSCNVKVTSAADVIPSDWRWPWEWCAGCRCASLLSPAVIK